MNAPGPSNDEYETPPWFFKGYDTEFGFTFDAAANEKNHLCERWTGSIEETTSGITPVGKTIRSEDRIWCNPPYSNIELFVRVALFSSNLWVFLLPSRTGNDWYRLLWESKRVEWRPLRKRIQFLIDGKAPINPKTGKPSGPRFDSLVAIVRPR